MTLSETNFEAQIDELDLNGDEVEIIEAMETQTALEISSPIVRTTRFAYTSISQSLD